MALKIPSSPLFRDIAADELPTLLTCLNATEKKVRAGTMLLHAGDITRQFAIVLSGSVRIERCDIWGNTSILDHIGPGRVFGEVYACLPTMPVMVDAVAAEDSTLLYLQADRLFSSCQKACACHQQLIQNLLVVMASRNLHLAQKIELITPKTIRERLLTYLSAEALRQGKDAFTIPFNRQQLADYLACERSALSATLSKMQQEGLLTFRKNQFILNRQVRKEFHNEKE
jgi:CRP-like cAMP-binding protein